MKLMVKSAILFNVSVSEPRSHYNNSYYLHQVYGDGIVNAEMKCTMYQGMNKGMMCVTELCYHEVLSVELSDTAST